MSAYEKKFMCRYIFYLSTESVPMANPQDLVYTRRDTFKISAGILALLSVGPASVSGKRSERIRWTFDVPGEVSPSVSYSDNTVIITGESTIWGVDAQSGNTKWERSFGGYFRAFSLVENSFYLNIDGMDNSSKILSFNVESGEENWNFKSNSIAHAQTIIDEKLYYYNSERKVNALKLDSGKLDWEQPVPNTSGVNDSASAKDSIYFIQDGSKFQNKLVAYNKTSGNPQWSRQNVQAIRDISNNVIFGTQYLESDSGNPYGVFALEGDTGEELWVFTNNKDLSTFLHTKIYKRNIFVLDLRNSKVYSLNKETGVKQWESKISNNRLQARSVVADGYLYITDENGFLFVLDVETGDKNWEFQTGGKKTSAPVVSGDTVFVGSTNDSPNPNYLYGLETVSGLQRWAFNTNKGIKQHETPVVVDESVFVSSDSGVVYALNRKTSTSNITVPFTERTKYEKVDSFGPQIEIEYGNNPKPVFADVVDIDGDLMIAGANDSATYEQSWGQAEIFRQENNEWVREKVISTKNIDYGSASFGAAVGITNQIALVGDIEQGSINSNREGGAGTVYVFTYGRNGWKLSQTLRGSESKGPNEASFIDTFGSHIAISGDTALIGDATNNYSGFLAYIFKLHNKKWSEESVIKVPVSAPDTPNLTPESFAIDNNTIVMADGRNIGPEKVEHRVTILRRTDGDWVEEKRLRGDGELKGSALGNGLDVHRDTVVIGAPGMGIVFVYERSNGEWEKVQELEPSDDSSDWFGGSVTVTQGRLFIGEKRHDEPGEQNFGQMHAYIKKNDQWVRRNIFRDEGGKFGASSAYSDGNLVVGAPYNTVPTDQSFEPLHSVGRAVLYEEIEKSSSATSDEQIKISNLNLQPSYIKEQSSSHILTFTVINISGDNNPDQFEVTIPDTVAIDKIESIEATPNYEPAWNISGNTIEFSINPDTIVQNFDMDVTVHLILEYVG